MKNLFIKVALKLLQLCGVNAIGFKGQYTAVCYDSNGNAKWKEDVTNLIPTEGLIEFLRLIAGQSTSTSWYLGLGTASYTPSSTATGATIASLVGEFTGYTETTRPVFVKPEVTGTTISNSASNAVFTVNAGATITNAFLITDSTKNGTSGKALSVVALTQSRPVVSGDTIKLEYGITAVSQS